MDDPDVVILADGDAGDLAENPIAGQRLGPERLDLELRRLVGAGRLLGVARAAGGYCGKRERGGERTGHGFLPVLSALSLVWRTLAAMLIDRGRER